jgi:hypothetical protein
MNYDLSKLGNKERSFLATLLQLSYSITTALTYSIASAITLGLKDDKHVLTCTDDRLFKQQIVKINWTNSLIIFQINDDNWNKIVKKFKLKKK